MTHNIPTEAKIECTDGHGGDLVTLIVNPVSRQLTYIVVDQKELFQDPVQRLVPMEMVVKTTDDTIYLNCTKDELSLMQNFIEEHYNVMQAAPWWGAHMEPGRVRGEPMVTGRETIAYADQYERIPTGELAVRPGMSVEASDGKVGELGELVVDPKGEFVTHVVLREGHLWGKKEVSLPLSAIDKVEDDIVYLKLDKESVEKLPSMPLKRHYKHRDPEQELAVKVYDSVDGASKGLAFVKDLDGRDIVRIRESAIVVKEEDGTVSLKDTGDVDKKGGRLFGAITGGLVGLVGGPVGMVVGALAGAGAGGLAAKMIDFGFSDKFIAEVVEHLKPGSSALLLVVEHEWKVTLAESLGDDDGILMQQTLTDQLVDNMLGESEEEE